MKRVTEAGTLGSAKKKDTRETKTSAVHKNKDDKRPQRKKKHSIIPRQRAVFGRGRSTPKKLSTKSRILKEETVPPRREMARLNRELLVQEGVVS